MLRAKIACLIFTVAVFQSLKYKYGLLERTFVAVPCLKMARNRTHGVNLVEV